MNTPKLGKLKEIRELRGAVLECMDRNIGKQLYDKYDLSREERDFIEKMIKKM